MNFRIFIKKFLPGGTFTREFCIQDGFTGMKELTLVDPKLHMIQSAAGSFECSFHKDSVVYKSNADDNKPWVEMGKTRIIIRRYEDEKKENGIVIPAEYATGVIIWEGRVLNVETDFYGQEHIYAEGALSYLNDSIQPTKAYTIKNYSPASYYILKAILDEHNSQCPDKQITLQDFNTLATRLPTDIDNNVKQIDIGNETTMSAVSKMISVFGGKMRIVYDKSNAARLEWYKIGDEPISTDIKISEIIFTKNMLDYQKKRDLTSLISYVYPRGYKAYSAGDYAVGDDMMKPPDGSDVCPITWNMGSYIWMPNDLRGSTYEWAYNQSSPNWYEDTMSTGFALSALGVSVLPDDQPLPGSGGLEVKPGEIYYISLTQSDSRACYVVTAGYLGVDGSVVIGYQTASSNNYPFSTTPSTSHGVTTDTKQYPTVWTYQKIQIPTDIPDDLKKKNQDGSIKTDSDGNIEYNTHFYLNISSRGSFNQNNDQYDGRWLGLFWDNDESKNRIAGIWKGRYLPADEHITLKGLGDGSYDVFFVSISGTSVPVKCKSQAGKDRAILFPKPSKDKNPEPAEPLANEDALPPIETVLIFDTYRVYSNEIPGGVTRYTKPQGPNPDTGVYEWEECVVDTLTELEAKKIDPGMAFFVKSEQKWWVKLGGAWYEQKPFHRDGFYIYNDALATQYGRIAKFVDYSNVIDPDVLEENALSYLYASEFENLTLTVKALDLGIIEPDNSISVPFSVLGQVRVTSSYHGLSDKFYIQEIEYDFNNLGNTEIEIGYTKINRITENTKDFIKVG